MDRNKEEMAEELDRRCKEEMGSYKEEMDRNKEEMAEELDCRCKEEMGSYKEEMERYKEEQIETKGALDRLLQQLKPVLSSSSKSSQPVPKVTRHFDTCTSFTDFAKHSVIQKTPKPVKLFEDLTIQSLQNTTTPSRKLNNDIFIYIDLHVYT